MKTFLGMVIIIFVLTLVACVQDNVHRSGGILPPAGDESHYLQLHGRQDAVPTATQPDSETGSHASESPSSEADFYAVESTALDATTILELITGHWIDSAIYYSPVPNADLLWPLERIFYPQGMAQDSGRPLSAFVIGGTGSPVFIFPMAVRDLGDGLVELAVDTSKSVHCYIKLFHHDPTAPGYCHCQRPNAGEHDLTYLFNHRIIIDTSNQEINEIIYYIGNETRTLVRFCWERNAARYTYEQIENGIRIRYFAGIGAFPRFFEELWIYRSTKEGHRGERIITHAVEGGFDDSIFYEFIDKTAQPGQTYFYSIWPSHEWTHREEPLFFGDRWHMVVTTY